MTEPQPITCDECQSRLEEFALDELATEPCARVAEHLAGGCSVCNQCLSEILIGFAQLAHSLPMERPTMRVDRALRDRMADERSPEKIRLVASSVETTKVPSKWLTRGLVAAAVGLAATVLGIAAWTARHNSSNDLASAAGLWDEMRLRVEQADASQKFPAIPQMQFASLGTRKLATPVNGYIVEDRLTGQWHLYAFHLPKLEAGHTYQVWFDMGNSRFVRAGTAEVDEEGTIHRLIDVPLGAGPVTGLAISDETSADSERPSGDNLVEAKLQ